MADGDKAPSPESQIHRTQERTAGKLLGEYPPSAGPALAGIGNIPNPFDHDAQSLNNQAIKDLPQHLEFIALLTRGHKPSGEEQSPRGEPDFVLENRAGWASFFLADGKITNSERLQLWTDLQNTYHNGGPAAEEALLNRINANLKKAGKDTGVVYQLEHTDSQLNNNPSARAYKLVRLADGKVQEEKTILDVDLAKPAPAISPAETIADILDQGTINDAERSLIRQSFNEAYKRGGAAEERKLLNDTIANLKLIESNFDLNPGNLPNTTGERNYQLVDRTSSKTKDTINYKIGPIKSNEERKTAEEAKKTLLTQAVQNLGSRSFDIRRDAETTLRNAGPAALKYLKDGLKSADENVSSRAWSIIQSRYAQYTEHLPFEGALATWNKVANIPMSTFAEVARLASVDDETAQVRLQEIKDLKAIMSDPSNRQLTDEQRQDILANLGNHQFDYENLSDRKARIKEVGATVKALRASGDDDDKMLACVIGAAPNLEHLDLSGSKITNAGLEHIQRLKNIQELDLSRTQVTDEGLKAIKDVKSLTHLNLNETNVTDIGMGYVKNLSKLSALSLNFTQITGSGLAEIKNLKNLNRLRLDGTDITDKGLAEIKDMTSLRDLSLNGTRITDAGVAHLAGLTKLYGLDLSNTRVTDQALPSIANLTKLTHLLFENDNITDAAVNDLIKHKANLSYLNVKGTNITRQGRDTLRKARKGAVTPHEDEENQRSSGLLV